MGGLETRLAGVVVAALKEAFDRDTRRLDLEHEQMAAERLRAERALRLELRRQAADREIARVRLLAAAALASWLGTLFFAGRVIHTLVQTLTDNVRLRGQVFLINFAGVVVLAGHLVLLALDGLGR